MIPVSKPCLNADDIKSTVDAIQSGWISSLGTEIRGFEEDFANYIGDELPVWF